MVFSSHVYLCQRALEKTMILHKELALLYCYDLFAGETKIVVTLLYIFLNS